MNSDQVHQHIEHLADQIVSTGFSPLVLVGIREGGDIIAARLAKILAQKSVAVEAIGALDITLYRDDFGHRQHWPNVKASEISVDLNDKNIVLVDDVIFTGRTIRAAMNALLDYGRPERIILAVMIDRGHRQLPIQPDLVASTQEINRDVLCLARFTEQGAEQDSVVLSEAI